ncbi:hypothetical protein MRX96_053740 [Rhipicephalus microplus]
MFANVTERTITKHFRCYMTSLEMSMNSMAAMFSWTKGMLRSTKLDNDSRLVDFARMLEKAVAQLFPVQIHDARHRNVFRRVGNRAQEGLLEHA